MDYKNYKVSRDLSWKILLDTGIKILPIHISDVCRQMGIAVRLYRPSDNNDGMCMLLDGKPFILVSGDCPPVRQRFTTAHELGHILLGHVGKYTLVNRDPSPTDNPIEQAANVFASRLLAPACVLWGCNARTAEDIMHLCNISHQAAEYRMERMRVLYQRDKFLTSPLERAVYEQFEEFIRDHRL